MKWSTTLFVVLQTLTVAAGDVGNASEGAVGAQSRADVVADEYAFPSECDGAAVWSSMTCTRSDQILIGLCRNNLPTHLLQFDDGSRSFVAATCIDTIIDDSRWPVKQAKIHSQLCELKDGWVYGGTHCSEHGQEANYEGGHWFRYSPRTHKMEDLGLAMRYEGLITVQADETNNCLYAITYPGAYLLRFDLRQHRTELLGKTSSDKRVDRYFQVFSNGLVCANQVKAGPGRMGGLFLFDVQAERESVLYPALYRRTQSGTYSRYDTSGAAEVYNMWIAGTSNASGSIGYVASQTSGHLLSVHAVGRDSVAIYDRGEMLQFVQGSERREKQDAATSQAAEERPRGFLCHAMAEDPNGNICFTVTLGGEIDNVSGSEQTYLLRYDSRADRTVNLGVIRTASRKNVISSTAMAISSSGAIYLAAATEDRHQPCLLRLDPARNQSLGQSGLVHISNAAAQE